MFRHCVIFSHPMACVVSWYINLSSYWLRFRQVLRAVVTWPGQKFQITAASKEARDNLHPAGGCRGRGRDGVQTQYDYIREKIWEKLHNYPTLPICQADWCMYRFTKHCRTSADVAVLHLTATIRSAEQTHTKPASLLPPKPTSL